MNDIYQMRFKISSNIVAQNFENSIFIYDENTGFCFGLEGIGSEIWQLISEGKTVKEIIDSVKKEYCVDENTVRDDLQLLTDQLTAKEIIISCEFL
jgi:hypothetical protein